MTDIKNKRISHSAYKKYLTCGKMYDYYYNDKLRPTGSSTSLIFGTAMDEALNALLLKTGDPYEVFKEYLKLEDMEKAEVHKDDYDPHIFTTEQADKLKGRQMEYRIWASLRVKGRMLLDAYMADIYPKITKVHSVQKDLDGRRGVIDAIVDIKGYGKVLLDHKTSARPYKRDAIEADTQLHLYAKHEGIDQIGFAVLVKKIDYVKTCVKCGAICETSHKTCPQTKGTKRCHGVFDMAPAVKTQLIIDKVIPAQTEMLTESIEGVERAIELGVYPRNTNSCRSYFGKSCPYLNKCLHNKEDGLELKND